MEKCSICSSLVPFGEHLFTALNETFDGECAAPPPALSPTGIFQMTCSGHDFVSKMRESRPVLFASDSFKSIPQSNADGASQVKKPVLDGEKAHFPEHIHLCFAIKFPCDYQVLYG